jgi:metal-responsive CopG/Arc/MetJ family transcriptional regulator
MKKKSKVVISVSIDKQLSNLIKENMSNKSKYIEWLIYQDLKKYSKNEKINKIIL